MKGRVLKSTGSWYDVKTESGVLLKCRLRGKHKLKDLKTTNPVAVGDQVQIEEKGGREGVITEVLPRKNYIIRKSTKKEAQAHIMASNVDQAILMVSLIFPKTSIGFIDRYLVAAESFRIPVRILFNKSDLLKDKMYHLYEQLSDLYKGLGYENVLISAEKDEDLNFLKEWLKGKINLLSGHSGVGKSTLLNRLNSELKLTTREVSSYAEKGTHATTFASMYELWEDTYVIDTPGIKELGLMDMESWEISHYFPEMREHLGSCKYNNCLHINEPGCQVIEWLKKGKIAESRYRSYLSMIEDFDSHR